MVSESAANNSCFRKRKPLPRPAPARVGVDPALSHQAVMATLLHNPALVHHHNPIGVADRAQPVGDHQGGAVLGDLRQRALDGGFGVVVDGSGGFVEHQHRGIFEDGAGQGDALALPAREARPRSPTKVS